MNVSISPNGVIPLGTTLMISITGANPGDSVAVYAPAQFNGTIPVGNVWSDGTFQVTWPTNSSYIGTNTIQIYINYALAYTTSITVNANSDTVTNTTAGNVQTTPIATQTPQATNNVVNTTNTNATTPGGTNPITATTNAQAASTASNSTDLIIGGVDLSTSYFGIPLWMLAAAGVALLFLGGGSSHKRGY